MQKLNNTHYHHQNRNYFSNKTKGNRKDFRIEMERAEKLDETDYRYKIRELLEKEQQLQNELEYYEDFNDYRDRFTMKTIKGELAIVRVLMDELMMRRNIQKNYNNHTTIDDGKYMKRRRNKLRNALQIRRMNLRGKKVCTNCGRPDHFWKKCPFDPSGHLRCFRCGSFNHWVAKCPIRKYDYNGTILNYQCKKWRQIHRRNIRR